MSLDWEAHTCSWYCRNDVHAFPVLAKPALSAALIAAALQQAGETVVSVQPAREADVPMWQADMLRHGVTGHTRAGESGPLAAQDFLASQTPYSVPFLVLVRAQEGNDHDSA